MKKILALLMAFTLAATCLSLASCGEKKESENTTTASASTSDYDYVKSNGKLTIGYTLAPPMNYTENKEFVGFDTEYAVAVCKKLGVEPNFVEINWDTKEVELSSKKIDCIWNGFTITEEREKSLDFTDAYMKNKQVVVIRTADKSKYTDAASLASAKLTAETASAGEETIKADSNLKKASYAESEKQNSAMLAVKAKSFDACVIDYTMAFASVGKGNLNDLMILDCLDVEYDNYGIGFRTGSDLVAKVNDISKELVKDGTIGKIAEKYNLTDLMLIK